MRFFSKLNSGQNLFFNFFFFKISIHFIHFDFNRFFYFKEFFLTADKGNNRTSYFIEIVYQFYKEIYLNFHNIQDRSWKKYWWLKRIFEAHLISHTVSMIYELTSRPLQLSLPKSFLTSWVISIKILNFVFIIVKKYFSIDLNILQRLKYFMNVFANYKNYWRFFSVFYQKILNSIRHS